jgi:hypothetical protein
MAGIMFPVPAFVAAAVPAGTDTLAASFIWTVRTVEEHRGRAGVGRGAEFFVDMPALRGNTHLYSLFLCIAAVYHDQ